eukprot:s2836_g8.t1
MLAPRALQAEASTPAQPRRRVPDQTRWALSHLGQALLGCALEAVAYSVGLDGPGSFAAAYEPSLGDFLGKHGGGPDRQHQALLRLPEWQPQKSCPASRVCPRFRMLSFAVTRLVSSNQSWIHCAQCHSRWLLSPRSASLMMGRALEEPAEAPKAKAKMRSSRPATAETARAKSPKRSQGSMEDGDWSMGKEADYVKVFADQEEKMEQLQAQLDLLTGKAMEFPSPAKRTHLRPSSRPSCGLQVAESETRFKSNHFPTKDTREEWVQAAQNYKKGAEQMLAFYQRSQLASRLMRGVWAPSRCRDHGVEALFASYCGKVAGVPGAGLADFVV